MPGAVINNQPPPPSPPPPPVQVTMNRASVPPTADQALWVVIRNSAEALSFENYAEFIEPIMGGGHPQRSQGHFAKISQAVQLAFPDAEPYRLLKVATEVFMMANCGVVIDENLQGTVDSTTLAEADFSSLSSDPALVEEEQLRLLRSPTAPPSIESQWQQAYLQPLSTTATPAGPGIVGIPAGPIETIPYLYDIVALKLGDVPILAKDAYGARQYYGILQRKLTQPCLLELIG